MNWTEEHNVVLCREVLVSEPYQFKIGSRERGHCWDIVATNLNGLEHPQFLVDKRALRDHLVKLTKGHKRKMAKEERASGISPDMSELDKALETITGRMEGAEEELKRSEQCKSKEVEKERETAENVRKRAMESIGESREREESEGGARKRRLDKKSEAIEYLKGRHDEDVSLKKIELELKKREIALKEMAQQQNYELKKRELELKEREKDDRRNEIAGMEERETRFMNLLQQQQLIFSKISQQNQLLLNLLKNLTEK